MTVPATETLHPDAPGLDAREPREIARVLAAGQATAAAAAEGAIEAICVGAASMAASLRGGGRLIYVAAGSSGLMAAADALELFGTFGIAQDRVKILMAGGLPQGVDMPGATEDETASLDGDMADTGPADTVIAVSASGTTPYTLAAGRIARDKGARLIGIANNSGSALLEMADHAVLLATPPEVVAGSTRMGAATAQKIALNMLSTLMAVELGHIHDGMMVNVVADNEKLQRRACGIVSTITGATPEAAAAALARTDGRVKPAVLVARAGIAPEAAERILTETEGNLRAALAQV